MTHCFEATLLAGGKTLALKLYGYIGSSDMWGDGISAKSVSQAIEQAGDIDLINVKLNSGGGKVHEGFAIRSILASHKARCEMDIEGVAASVASVIAMAGDVIRMHEGASLMIHESETVTVGSIAEHDKSISALTAFNDNAAAVYAQRSGKSKDKCLKLMAAETWFTPEQAKSEGFADEIVPGKAPAPTMSFDFAKLGYRNVPPHLAAEMMLAPPAREHRDTMTQPSFARVALAVGLSGDGAEEAAVMSAIDKMNKTISAREAVFAELRLITNMASDQEVLGAIRGLATSATQLVEVKAQLAAQTKQLEEQERAAVLAADAADPKGRKLTPAMLPYWEGKPVAELKAFLAVAPHVLKPGAPTLVRDAANEQPKVTSRGDGAGTSAPTPVLVHEGKTWAQMHGGEKHNLRIENPEMFAAMRDQHAAEHG